MRQIAVLLAATLMVGGCSSDSPRDNPTMPVDGVGSILLSSSSADSMTSTGDTRTMTAVVLDVEQRVVTPAPTVSWTTSAPSVATVTTEGPIATVTAVGDGIATIEATSGVLKKTTTVRVHRVLASLAITPLPPMGIGFGEQLTTTARDARGHEITGLTSLTYSSNNPTTVVVSPTGFVNTLFQFPQTLSATITATATKEGVTVQDTTHVTVVPPVHIDDAALMLSDYIRPVPVRNQAAGIAFFLRDEGVPVGSRRFFYEVTWSAMSGPAISAHMHSGTSLENQGDVLVNFPLTPSSTNFGTLLGIVNESDILPQGGRPAISMDSLTTLFNNGNVFIDVHTANNPAGEIRGRTVRLTGSSAALFDSARCVRLSCP